MAAPLPLQLAGMALRNGVLVVGPSRWAVAVRDDAGMLHVEEGAHPVIGARIATRVPGLRGILRIAGVLWLVPHARRASPHARLAVEAPAMVGGIIAGMLLGGAVRAAASSDARGELYAGAVSLGCMLTALRAGELCGYHGAEHKAIAGYEQGIDASQA